MVTSVDDDDDEMECRLQLLLLLVTVTKVVRRSENAKRSLPVHWDWPATRATPIRASEGSRFGKSRPSDCERNGANNRSLSAARASLDFDHASGTLTIPAGQTTASLQVPLIDDAEIEADELFKVYFTNGIGIDLPPNLQTTVTLVDDDQASFSLNAQSGAEGDDLAITVTLDLPAATETRCRLTFSSVPLGPQGDGGFERPSRVGPDDGQWFLRDGIDRRNPSPALSRLVDRESVPPCPASRARVRDG